MGAELKLVVYGTPVPQGSKRAFYVKRLKRPVIVEDNKRTKPWRQEVAAAAVEAMERAGFAVVGDLPVELICTLFFDRPKSLRKSIRSKTTNPDCDKLARLIGDALTGTVFKNDAQITDLVVRKRFSDTPRAEIHVKIYGHEEAPC